MRKQLLLLSAGLGLITVTPTMARENKSETKTKSVAVLAQKPAAMVVQKMRITTTHAYFDGTMKELIMNDDRFLLLARALKVGKLEAMLDSSEMKYTLFAPTNDALTNLPQERFVELFDSQEKMRKLIFSHMVRGTHDMAAVMERDNMMSMSGEEIDIDVLGGLEVEEHRLVSVNIVTKNGVVHIIDGVIPTNDIDT